MREITYDQAAAEAIHEEFRRNPKTVHMSTDLAADLQKEFGANRVRVTPIAENSFVGASIGLAGSGFRTVVNLRMATFGFVALDQMMNHAAKIHYMTGGQAQFPILIRMTVGAGFSGAAEHSISPYSMFMNVPGLKILLPTTPYDVKGLLKTALRDNNPIISFEPFMLGKTIGEVPEDEYLIPLGKATVRKKGSDVTVVALARMVPEALAAAEALDKENVSVEVIDPLYRWIGKPFFDLSKKPEDSWLSMRHVRPAVRRRKLLRWQLPTKPLSAN
jgi:pyruvate/2-oxoglutarate/acetoin dehydrogenase E1 component